MHDDPELYTIGQLARRTGLSARTIRFWSDVGAVPPVARSPGGYRLYDAAAVERLELVSTLRQLGLDLATVRSVLEHRITLAEVAETHVRALDAQIAALRLNRAVLSTVALRGTTTQEMALMHKLAALSARERQQIIDGFIDRVFAGVEDEDALVIAGFMREMPTTLPDDPTAEQVDAWVELAELVSDPDFEAVLRAMIEHSEPDNRIEFGLAIRPLVLEYAGRAVDSEVAPRSEAGRLILDRIVPADLPESETASLSAWLSTVIEPRIERYWQLLSLINGAEPDKPSVPAFAWLAEALSAHR
ncbi:helix-turn-helix domain-containing protein [Nocardia salmonicida]|uniref:helix-turn-helix domain-containing protein n=1 Tax=Nocardia salmonicida TaxID=53431 RepID=UPI002E2BD64A|nr:MerR family transcriptional regulator [Nocardia salmonicida]